jgi:hypothetical protein
VDLAPEQLRALDYLRRRGTETPAAQLREHVARTLGEMETLLDGVPAGLRAVRPGPGRWSVQEVVDHLIESHRPALPQLGALLEGRSPASGAVPPSLQSAAPHERPWDELLAELRRIHRALIELLDAAHDGLSLEPTAPIAMVVKVAPEDGEPVPVTWEVRLDWKAFVQALRGHTAEHRQQVLRTLAALEGRLQEAR